MPQAGIIIQSILEIMYKIADIYWLVFEKQG